MIPEDLKVRMGWSGALRSDGSEGYRKAEAFSYRGREFLSADLQEGLFVAVEDFRMADVNGCGQFGKLREAVSCGNKIVDCLRKREGGNDVDEGSVSDEDEGSGIEGS